MTTGTAFFSGAAADSLAVSIYNSLVGWWDFEENNAGNTFNDSHGSNHLSLQTGTTPTATSAVSATGKVGRASTHSGVEDRTAFIPRSNTALDLPNSDFSFGGWIKTGGFSGGSTRFVMGRVGSSGTTIQAYILQRGSDDQIIFAASSDGSTVVTTTGFGIDGTYRFMVATFDRTNNLIRFRVPHLSINVTASFPSALYTTASAANFCFSDGLSSDTTYLSGDRALTAGGFDACFYAAKAFTDAEVAYLENSGNGMSHATLAAAAGH